MKTFFKVVLQNQIKEEVQCIWQVRDHKLAKQWVEILKSFEPERGYSSDFDWISVGNTAEHLNYIIDKMRVISENLVAEKNLDIPVHLYNNLTRDSLNILHMKFHELAEDLQPLSDSGLDWLNRVVHRAEMCIANIKNKSAGAFITLQLNAFKRIPIVDEDRSLFDSSILTPGLLVAGYSTIGKNLYSAYVDNDISLLENQMVRPKLDMSSEVRIVVTNQTINRTSNFNDYFKWCDSNKVLEKYGYDCRAAIHVPYELVLADPVEYDNTKLNDFLVSSDLGDSAKVKHWEVYTV